MPFLLRSSRVKPQVREAMWPEWWELPQRHGIKQRSRVRIGKCTLSK